MPQVRFQIRTKKVIAKLKNRLYKWLLAIVYPGVQPHDSVPYPIQVADRGRRILIQASGIEAYVEANRVELKARLTAQPIVSRDQVEAIAVQTLARQTEEIDQIKEYFFGNGIDRTQMNQLFAEELWLLIEDGSIV